VAIFRAKNCELLTNKNQILSTRKVHFEQHWSGDQVDLRDDGVEIDLTNREEIESALVYLEEQDGRNGGPQLLDALEEVIQLAWTSETLHESGAKRVYIYIVSSVQKRR
jgi:hypothetical protein